MAKGWSRAGAAIPFVWMLLSIRKTHETAQSSTTKSNMYISLWLHGLVDCKLFLDLLEKDG